MVLGANLVAGQEYPSKPIRISTVQTGGGSDFTARIVANGITGLLGQPIIVENRPTNIAVETAIKAPPDGYTILVGGAGIWVGTVIQKKPLWDPINDFTPITIAVNMPNVIVIHPLLPVKSVKDLIALAKSRPGELNYGQGAVGGNSHLAAELFNSMAGVKIVGIPYRGSGGNMAGLIGGEVQVGYENTIAVGPYVKAGKLRILAVSQKLPSALLPGVPTVEASGLPGYYLGSYQGIMAPAKTPAPIIRRLNQEIVRALNMPDVRQRLLDGGAEPNGNSPEEFAAQLKSDLIKFAKVVKDAHIELQ